jgi:hypothetical protein
MTTQLQSIVRVLLVLIFFYILASNFSSIYKIGKDFGKTVQESLLN